MHKVATAAAISRMLSKKLPPYGKPFRHFLAVKTGKPAFRREFPNGVLYHETTALWYSTAYSKPNMSLNKW